MVINITNGEIINTKDISLHDDILEELSFDRKNKKVHLILCRECDNRKISMFFRNHKVIFDYLFKSSYMPV